MTQAKHFSTRPLVRPVSALLLLTAWMANAAIVVQPTGTGVLPFNSLPPNTEWSSRHVLPNSGGAITTVEGLDVPVQTNSAAAINATLASNTGAANNQAAWHSSGFRLYTRPTGNSYQLLMGQFVNNIGDDANQITVTFDGAIITPTTGEAAGWRAFYSLSGAPGEWIVIPELSGFEPNGVVSATVNLASNWLSGNTLYLLFADDNANSITDPGYSIDNFELTAAPVNVVPINITNQPGSISVPERGSVTFTVGAEGAPQGYHWLRNGSPIPGANLPSYTIPSVSYPLDNGAVFSVIVSNSANSQTSSGATLTVTPDTTAPVALVANSSPDHLTVTVTFSEPMSPSDPSTFQIFPTGTNPDSTGVAPLSAVVNGSNYLLTLASALTEGVDYSIRIFDVYDTSEGVPAPGNLIEPYPTIIPIRRNLELIGFDNNNVWKYSISTNLFGTGWETVGYDDSDSVSWPSGEAALGVNTDANANAVPIRTPTAYQPNSAPQFFRRHFFLPSATNEVVLLMRHFFEDGAVVYLNGQEAGRYRVAPGALTVATRTTAAFTEGGPVEGPVVLPLTNVVAGDNVIAVVVIQSGGTSSDSIMALELIGNIAEYAAGPVTIGGQPQSQTVDEGADVTFSVSAGGALPLIFQWRRNGSPISGATNATYSITDVQPSQAGNYDVLITNSVNDAASAVATLTVTADTTAPVIVSAVGGTNLSEVVVTLYDEGGVDMTSAQTPANYEIRLTAGGGDLTVVSAVATTVGTNVVVTLTTSTPRTAGENYTVEVNVVDASAAQNITSPNTAPIVATVILFSFNGNWRYDQTGTDLGTAWKDLGYNDSAWPVGPGVLGFETSAATVNYLTNIAPPAGTNTVLSLTNGTGAGLGGTNITFYFRTTVNIASFNPASETVVFRGYVDDGAIVYVNGTERLRINHSNAPTYISLANGNSTEAALVVSNITGFVQGDNLIAVEVHQNAMDSSDVAWGLQLEALVTSFVAAGPTLRIVQSGGDVTITWTGGGTLQQSTNLNSPANWTNVPGSPTSPYTTPATGPGTFYRLVLP